MLNRRTKDGEEHVPVPPEFRISEIGCHFVSRCLSHAAKTRASATELLKHEWLIGKQISSLANHGVIDMS